MPKKNDTRRDGKDKRDKRAAADSSRDASDSSASRNDARSSGQKKRQRRSKANDHKSRDYRRDDRTAMNDVSWYSKYPELLVAAASVPYPYRPGMKIVIGKDNVTETIKPIEYEVPGVLSLDWAPSCGWSEDVTSPASIACKELYAKVRKSFSGSLDADPPDFLIYLMALDSIFSYIGALKRVYRVLNAYTPNNYALPVELAAHLGINPSDVAIFQSDRMHMYEVINTLIHMSEKFVCPAVMDIFNRHYWMNDNVYCDANSPAAQLYVFNQVYYYCYALQNTPDGVPAGGLEALSVSGVWNSVDAMFDFGKNLIDSLAASDDAYTISGYLMRAFEGEPSFRVSLLEYDERLELSYEPEVLMQIENATAIWEGNSQNLSLNVSQNPKTNSIISRPMVTYASTTAWIVNKATPDTFAVLLNVHNDNPTVADTVIASRLKTAMVGASSAETFKIVAGTEIVVAIYLTDKLEFDWLRVLPHISYNEIDMAQVFALEAFDWHPIAWTQYVGGSGDTAHIVRSFCWDIANLTTVTLAQLENINRVCVYSEFNAFNV